MAPARTAREARTHTTFTALLRALSAPGTPQHLPPGTPPFALIAEALLDLEVSYFTPDAALEPLLAQSGARRRQPDGAQYQFYPQLDGQALDLIGAAPVGTAAAPETSATLVIGCGLGRGPALRLSGPGISGSATLRAALPPLLWELRARVSFPLGWDLVLVDGAQLVGVPRSTAVGLGNL